jgi:hypothetical protein
MCKHEHVTGYMWREHKQGDERIRRWAHAFVQPGRVDHHHKVVCDDCGTWLPLGPSDESDERVAEEIEAARLAAHLQFDDFPDDEPEDEWADYGWAAHASDCDVYEGTWHGYLARQIATHSGDD